MKELAGWMNNYFVIDKSKLSKEEYLVILGILGRIETPNEIIKMEEWKYVGEEGLPQYYEKGGKFITEDEMKLYEKIDKELPQYHGISAEEVDNMKRDEERQKRNNERWEDIKQSLGYKEPVEFPAESTLKKEWFTNTIPEGNPIEHWAWYFGKVDPSRCDELKYNPDEIVEPKFLSREEAAAEEKKYGDMEKELMKRLNLRDGEDLPENYEESFIPMDDE